MPIWGALSLFSCECVDPDLGNGFVVGGSSLICLEIVMTSASLFSRTTHAARLAAVTVLGGLTMCSLPVAAQLGATDVTGIRLGASAAEVEATLRSLDPRFKYLIVYYADTNGKASTSVAAIKAAVQSGADLRGIDWSRENGFAVYFGESSGRAFAIYRQTANRQGISIPQTEAAVAEKYGPSRGTYPGIYVRNTDASGKAVDGCGGSGFGWQGGPGGYDPRCGQSLKVQFDPKSPGVAAGFQTWLFDHQLAKAAIEASQAKQQAAAQEAARKQQESLRANRPAL